MADQITRTAKWIEYEGKSIMLADYADLKSQDLVDAIKENEMAIVKMGNEGRSELLIVTDVTSGQIDTAVIEAFKSVTVAMKPYTKGSAVVGITGLRKFALDLVNTFSKLETKAFKTLEEGKEWLVKL